MKNILAATLLAFAVPSEILAAPNTYSAPKQALWIDVRTAGEFAEGHIGGAVNIPFERVAADINRFAPDKNTPVRLYCRSGRRAETALQSLKKAGYTDVQNLGAYESLKTQGLR